MGITISKVVIEPDEGTNFEEQLKSCLNRINNFRFSADESPVQVSFFINALSSRDFTNKREKILNRTTELKNPLLPVSIIAQPPANGMEIISELCVRKDLEGSEVSYRSSGNVSYAVVESNDLHEVYSGGITMGDTSQPLDVQIEEAFIIARDLLQNEGMNFSNVVRQWNYIENILGTSNFEKGTIQNYQLLNNIRTSFYNEVKFTGGYPAATGIGTSYGGFVLEIYAIRTLGNIVNKPVRNPKQYDAYNYSENILTDKGANVMFPKTTPKFERARILGSDENYAVVYISGTASIENEQTVGIGDVQQQNLVTINNISELISLKNLTNIGIDRQYKSHYSFVRVYIKDRENYEAVKEICEADYGTSAVNYLVADVCRGDLLLEIEGIVQLDFCESLSNDSSVKIENFDNRVLHRR